MKYKTIIMIGKPGSGKGAQSALLAKETGFKVFSTGLRLREIAKQNTSIGQKVKGIIESGALMPYWFASFLFQEAILSLSRDQGIIYEGACRKKPEAELFNDVMLWLKRPYKAVYIVVSDEIVTERLSKRSTLENRADDTDKKVKIRLKAYHDEVIHAVEFFREIGNIIEVNGDNTTEEVHKEILKKLELA